MFISKSVVALVTTDFFCTQSKYFSEFEPEFPTRAILPMRYILLLFVFAASLQSAIGQSRLVQIIHNSADTALTELDIYVNDSLVADNLAFRTATAFLTVPDQQGDTPTRIYINPSNSLDTADYYLRSDIPSEAGNYLAAVAGTLFQTPYTPQQTFRIDYLSNARITGSSPDNADVVFYHGSDDSPTIDIGEIGLNFPDVWVDDISYGQFSNYRTLGDSIYRIGLYDEESIILAISYAGFFKGPEHDGKAYALIASGFQIPEFNAFGPLFSMFIVGSDGGAFQEMLPANVLDSASVQLIHAMPDQASSVVDIYLNNEIWLNDFSFRSATPFLNIPANRNLRLAVCASTSTDTVGAYFDELLYLSTTNYTMVLAGMTNPSGFNPAEPVRLSVRDNARKAAIDNDEIDMLFYHAIPDGGTMDFKSIMPIVTTLTNNMNFGSYNFPSYLEITPYDFSLNLTDESGSTVYNSFLFPALSENLAGEAIVMLALGFLNPENNQAGSGAGFWYTTAAGGSLIECTKVTGNESINNESNFIVSPNPTSDFVRINLKNAPKNETEIRLFDLHGKQHYQAFLTGKEDQFTFSTSTFSSGLYIVEIRNSNFLQRWKLQIAH
jgi:hypothetical protein